MSRIQSLLSTEQWGACQSVIVAYSGGLDSTVLLHVMAHLRDSRALGGRALKAVHVHHGLSDLATEWQRHCERQASALAVEFHSANLSMDDQFIKNAGGMEAAARKERYRAFEQVMNEGDVLLQAHHQGDQAETLLLRLMRGAGPKGLAGIPARRTLTKGQLVRPLLDLEKEALQHCASELSLRWVEDPSNQDIHIERNFLRKEIMPLLENRWPGFAERWAGTADLCRQSDEQLEDYQAQGLNHCDWRSERLGYSLCLQTLREFPEASQSLLIRSALSRMKLPMPSRAQLTELDRQILMGGRQDSEAIVHTGACSFASHKGRLYCWPQNALPEVLPEHWQSEQPLLLGNGWELLAREVDPSEPGLWLAAELELRGREAFKRAHPLSRPHSQSTKKLLQEQGLEPWLRGHIPFIAYRGQLLAVGDLWVEKAGAECCQGLPGARYCQLTWRHVGSEK
ncbi:tRNA lysidine(34) synthetase TilS [Pseudoteredinibacter isoporae]|uniref:tRNA lysidine(34) synthetase TilS n=1 Tax=Pseudoteredinibacter isoporae TaxID=570281 RepID=UPI00160FD802|nr:tRNA lysidine(34) synthetase TilS [Pseudoteredinibacter isoporae]